MTLLALTAIGEDRPGILAAVTEPLARLGCNIEDSSSSILRGHFAVMLVLAAPDGVTAAQVSAALAPAAEKLGLVVTARPLREAPHVPAAPTHLVSVYGADHPGIAAGVTGLLAERGVNVAELTTRLLGTPAAPVYVMLLELVLPSTLPADALEADLRRLAAELRVELAMRPLESDAL